MGRKHFQNHWKEMVELQRTREPDPKAQQIEPEKDEEKKKEQETSAVPSPKPKQAFKPKPPRVGVMDRLRDARLLLHRQRYVVTSVSLCFIAFSLLGMFWPERGTQLDLVRVSGQVLVDGQPLTYGIINFVPEDGRASTGILDREGRFTLTCLDGRDGAVRGTHYIEIVPDGVPEEVGIEWSLPKSYADWRTSACPPQVITSPVSGLKIELQGLGEQERNSEDGDALALPSDHPERTPEASTAPLNR